MTDVYDRQVLSLLAYCVDELRGHTRAVEMYGHADKIINRSIMRNPIIIGSANEYRFGLPECPVLAMWREGGKWQRSRVGGGAHVADLKVAYYDRIPAAGRDHDGVTQAVNKADVIWQLLVEIVESLSLDEPETIKAAEIVDVMPQSYALAGVWDDGVIGFQASFELVHIGPIYQQLPPVLLEKITATLRLYQPIDTALDLTMSAEAEA
jgi:hypothetical protein